MLRRPLECASLTGDTTPADSPTPVTGHPGHSGQRHKAADLPGQPDTARPVTDRAEDAAPVTRDQNSQTADPGQPVTQPPVTDRGTRTPGDRRPDPDTEELLKIARSAVRTQDKLTRKVVAQAIRGQQIPLSSDTLTTLMAQLRAQHGQPVTSTRP
ncbi:hypothetical protein JCM4814A_36150 [Streptomyces phaeofaciens JCM 4814]